MHSYKKISFMDKFQPIVIIPTYNEAENIKIFLEEIFKICPSINALVVDDNSPDGTANIVKDLQDDRIYILNRPEKSGIATAYIEGFKYASDLGFNAFIEMDADFSHKPEYLLQMIENLQKYDFVVGSRNIKGGKVENWSISRKLISKFGSLYSKIILNCPINDLIGGFNGWNKQVLDSINLDDIISKGYSFQIELKYKAFKKGFKYIEFPIIFPDRERGISKMNKKIFIEALINVIKIRVGYEYFKK